jgi:serine phosphatase RsbU (regulator of sigma subunit)
MRVPLARKLFTLLGVAAVVPTVAGLAVSSNVLRDASARATDDAREIARRSMREALTREATTLAAGVVAQVIDPLVARDFDAMKGVVVTAERSPNVRDVRVFDAEGVLLADGTNAPALRVQHREPVVNDATGDAMNSLRIEAPITAADRPIGVVEVRVGLDAENRAERALVENLGQRRSEGERSLLLASGAVGFCFAVIMLAVSALFGRRLARPIVALRDGTARVAEGDLGVRVSAQSNDEIGDLARGFNAMTAELADARALLQEQARISREMEIAESIQTSLVPRAPHHTEFEFAGAMEPAAVVGGDFYDILADGDDPLWLAIGDVSNHGLASGLVMLMTYSALSTARALGGAQKPDECLRRVNRVLYASIRERMRDNKYVTGLVLVHRGGGRFDYAGAHPPPLVWRAASGRCEVVRVEGTWLGIVPELPPIPVATVELREGDVLCLYTDGVIEARNGTGEQFDIHRLIETVERYAASIELDRLVRDVLASVHAFSSTRDDDRTLLVARRRSSATLPVMNAVDDTRARLRELS